LWGLQNLFALRRYKALNTEVYTEHAIPDPSILNTAPSSVHFTVHWISTGMRCITTFRATTDRINNGGPIIL